MVIHVSAFWACPARCSDEFPRVEFAGLIGIFIFKCSLEMKNNYTKKQFSAFKSGTMYSI